MNFLYPSFLRKIDHYLKINYPHIWRTRVHDFGWFSLVLGNVLTAILGMLIVRRNNVISEEGLMTMHISLAILLGFVALFWVVRLVRFKLKFHDIEMLLTTWLIYVFCLLSLGMNLVVFTSAVAYRTASLYSDEVVWADYDYVYDTFGHHRYDSPSGGSPYDYNLRLKDAYLTEDLSTILLCYGYDINKKIHRQDVNHLLDRISILKSAKKFIKQPVLGSEYSDYEKRTFYHESLNDGWIMGIILLFFLPTLLFLLSSFGLKNVLVSAFCTAIFVILGSILVNIADVGDYPESFLAVCVMTVFILKMIFMSDGNKLRSRNYIGGVIMLMYGVIFFAGVISIDIAHESCTSSYEDSLLIFVAILPMALLVLFMTGWFVTKYKYQPILH